MKNIFHVGSLSLTEQPASDTTHYAIRRAKEKGSIISYDPNYRASLWKDEETAKEQMRNLIPYVDIMKISDEETKLLTDKESPKEAAEIRGCFYHQKISFFHSPHGKERSAMTSQIHPLKPCPHTFHGHSLPLR